MAKCPESASNAREQLTEVTSSHAFTHATNVQFLYTPSWKHSLHAPSQTLDQHAPPYVPTGFGTIAEEIQPTMF